MPTNRQWRLAARPKGEPKPSDFKWVETPAPQVGPGQALLKTLWLSLDPYMRGRMNEGKSYAAAANIDDVMVGGTVSQVVESSLPALKVGQIVSAFAGWQDYQLSNGQGLMPLDPKELPITTALGVCGMPGVTAYVGLLDIGKPKPGETVVVSAASGAVGATVGQIAKLKGCRAVGIAGGKDKCDWVVKEAGFDACVDYKSGDVFKQLKDACPKGIDVYFDNVGGDILEACLRLLNTFARIPLCGMISRYNDDGSAPGYKNLLSLLSNRALIHGFIVSDHMNRWPEAIKDLRGWVKDGKIKYRETVSNGLETAPDAFIGLLRGKNFGKQLVKVADPI